MLFLKHVRSIVIKYLDTSVIYDFYVKGSRSKKVQIFINKYQSELGISLWVKTEFYGVLGRRVRDGGLPLHLAERAAKRFELHHQQGLYTLFAIDTKVFEQAAQYTRRFQLSIKSPDAIHLSVVQLEQLELVTSDQGLASFAKQLGISLTLIK